MVKVGYKKGDVCTIIGKSGGHQFSLGTTVVIISVHDKHTGNPYYYAERENSNKVPSFGVDGWYVSYNDIKLKNKYMASQKKKDLVLEAAESLLKANNTVTTLEIKSRLLFDYEKEYYWDQQMISDIMDELAAGRWTYTTVGSGASAHRVYSAINSPVPSSPKASTSKGRRSTTTATKTVKPASKTKYMSRKDAQARMENNRGHFFTATFIDKEGAERVMNCQYLANQGAPVLGYIKVKEASKLRDKTQPNPIRQVNLQTLKSLKIGGELYRIK